MLLTLKEDNTTSSLFICSYYMHRWCSGIFLSMYIVASACVIYYWLEGNDCDMHIYSDIAKL